jgi:hypothetical protein
MNPGRRKPLNATDKHHWDSMMVVEETTASLFPSDLFIQPNDQPTIVRENLGADMCEWYRAAGLFGGDMRGFPEAQPVPSQMDHVAVLHALERTRVVPLLKVDPSPH